MSYRSWISCFVVSVGVLLVAGGAASAAVMTPVTYNILSGQTVNMAGDAYGLINGETVLIEHKAADITASGTIPVQLSATFDPASHAASLTGLGCGINFVQQTLGTIAFGDGSLTYTELNGLTVSWNSLQGTILTPTPPGAVTGSGTSLSFDLTKHAVLMNSGTASLDGYPVVDFATKVPNDPKSPTSGTGTITLSAAANPHGVLINSSGYHVTYDYATSLTVPISYTQSEPLGDLTANLTAAGTVNTDTQTLSYTFNYLPGDANFDGVVDATDLNTVLSYYNAASGSDKWARGDFDVGGITDATDLNTVLSYYNQHSGSVMVGLNTAIVPEPGTIVMLLSLVLSLAGLGLWKRSR